MGRQRVVFQHVPTFPDAGHRRPSDCGCDCGRGAVSRAVRDSTPGPTLNTLGKGSSGQPLIAITGHPTYPTNGHLNLVTISYQGGPGANLNVFEALRAWLDPSEAVVPQSELFPPGQTAQQTQAQDTEQMASSQELATAAALTELHIKYQTQVEVLSTAAGYPASKCSRPGTSSRRWTASR